MVPLIAVIAADPIALLSSFEAPFALVLLLNVDPIAQVRDLVLRVLLYSLPSAIEGTELVTLPVAFLGGNS